MEIRRYRPGEEEAVWKVVFAATRESIARDYHADLIERWAPREKDMAEWADRLARTNPFVAIAEGEIVGMAEIDAAGFIDYFYVAPAWQNRGVGKALMAQLEAAAGESDAQMIRANVSVTAKAFFEARGFRVAEAMNRLIQGHPAPNFRMEKVLAGKRAE